MSLSVAVSVHDRVGEFLLLLESTNGRDRLCRLMQFSAKYLKWKEETEKRDVQRVVMWDNVSTAMSMVRKALRLFRSLAVLRALHRSLPSLLSELTVEAACNLMAKLCLASYFFFDHWDYAIRLGMWTPEQSTRMRVNQLTDGSWLGEIVFTLLEHVVKLHAVLTEETTVSVLVGGGVIAGVVTSAAGWEERKNAVLRVIVRYALDLPIALHLLGLTGKQPHGHFGVLGALSSLMAMYDSWPAVIVAPLKRVA